MTLTPILTLTTIMMPTDSVNDAYVCLWALENEWVIKLSSTEINRTEAHKSEWAAVESRNGKREIYTKRVM